MQYVDISTWVGGTRWQALWNGDSVNDLGVTADDFCSLFCRKFCNCFCNTGRRCGIFGLSRNNGATRACCVACLRVCRNVCGQVFAARANAVNFCECFSADFCRNFCNQFCDVLADTTTGNSCCCREGRVEACREACCDRCCAIAPVVCRAVLAELGANRNCCG